MDIPLREKKGNNKLKSNRAKRQSMKKCFTFLLFPLRRIRFHFVALVADTRTSFSSGSN